MNFSIRLILNIIYVCAYVHKLRKRARGQCFVYYTSPQSLIITFVFCWLNNFGDFSEFRLFESLSVQTFQWLIVEYFCVSSLGIIPQIIGHCLIPSDPCHEPTWSCNANGIWFFTRLLWRRNCFLCNFKTFLDISHLELLDLLQYTVKYCW